MSKKLRVTIVGLNYAPEPTGNAPYTTSLAEGLAAAGHSVRVVTGYPHYPEWRLGEGYSGWSRSEVINGVDVLRLRHHIPRTTNSLSRMHMELSFGLRLLFANWGRPDVVLTVSPALFSSALALLRVGLMPKGPAAGIWVQDIYSRGILETGTGGRTTARIASRVESFILQRADHVVAIHERFHQHMVKALGVSSAKVRVIRNWTHLPTSPKTGHTEMRASLGWAPEDLVVLHAGNMGKKQGLNNVLEAARLAQERRSKVRFVLMGDGNQRKTLESLADGLVSVQFIDPLPGDEFMRALAAADILLVNELPGVKDMAVPSKLTSYFNAGIPVIAATDSGSVTATEIAASGGGVRVDAADPEALLNAAESLGSDLTTARALGACGLSYRYDTLSEGAALTQYNELITSLATARGR